MGLFGIDAQHTDQTSQQQQVGVQGGVAAGGIIGQRNVGAFSTGNITSPVTAAHGSTINIVSSNPEVATAAIGGIASLSADVLEGNQALATQAVNYASQNTQQALALLGAASGQPSIGVTVGAGPIAPPGSLSQPYSDATQVPQITQDQSGGILSGISPTVLLVAGAVLLLIIINNK